MYYFWPINFTFLMSCRMPAKVKTRNTPHIGVYRPLLKIWLAILNCYLVSNSKTLSLHLLMEGWLAVRYYGILGFTSILLGLFFFFFYFWQKGREMAAAVGHISHSLAVHLSPWCVRPCLLAMSVSAGECHECAETFWEDSQMAPDPHGAAVAAQTTN